MSTKPASTRRVNAMIKPPHFRSTLCCLLSLATLSMAAGCKPKAAPSSDRAEILIGATLPLTGAEARAGGFYKEGYELAFDEVTQQIISLLDTLVT